MTKIAGEYGERGTHLTTEFDAYPLIPTEVSNEIMTDVTENSAFLQLLQRLPNMGTRTRRIPVLSSLGYAEFTTPDLTTDDLTAGTDVQVDDERQLNLKGTPYGVADPGVVPNEGAPGLKKTHQMKWENVYINAETIAVVLPVPDDVADDAEYDIWEAMRPSIVEAFQQRVDAAGFWGFQRPVSWPSGIIPTAISRGNVVAEGAGLDLAEDVSNLMSILEQQAYDPTGFVADLSMKASLRNLRDNNNMPLFTPSMQAAQADQFYGLPIFYQRNGMWDPNVTRLITGKMAEAKYAIRQDMSFRIFDEGVVTDENGRVILNLMQQDCKAMRVVMRMGWAVPNPIHVRRPGRDGYPFAILTA